LKGLTVPKYTNSKIKMYVLFQEFISNTANTSENPYFCQIDTYTGIERGSSMIYTEFYEGHKRTTSVIFRINNS
jgi:hypothetical protein